MATLVELARAGKLNRLDAVLGDDQSEVRQIYLSPKLTKWLAEDLPKLESQWGLTEQTPELQVDARTASFVAGDPLAFNAQFNVLDPAAKGVWELKTADVRIFGWFKEKDKFIGVVANDATVIKTIGLYPGYRDEVVRFRDVLDLDEPKFIEGEHPDDVVSDWNFST